MIGIALTLGAMICAFRAFGAFFDLMVWHYQQKRLLTRQQAYCMRSKTHTSTNNRPTGH